MNWSEILRAEIESTYKTAEGLIDLVDDSELSWKPTSGKNWMTVGQLLHHLTDACGAPCKGFVTGDWGMPGGFDPSKLEPEEMLPPAEKLPTIDSVAEAKRLLVEDKNLALAMIAKAGEEGLTSRTASAPWDPQQMPLGRRLLQMIAHLAQHKAQLFYYLKLQGKPVNTSHLWAG